MKSDVSIENENNFLEDNLSQKIGYESLVISGYLSKEANFAESFPFVVAHDTGMWKELTGITDDLKFARKRMISPKHVYSGLSDVLNYKEVDFKNEKSLIDAIKGKEAWLAFNVSSNDVSDYTNYAIKANIKRVVFGIYINDINESGSITFEKECKKLNDANVKYTFIKFGSNVRKMDEAKFPYRIVKPTSDIPVEGEGFLASGDLMRVLAEIVDLPKTFDHVYAMGSGNYIDTEIQVYMKAQGWPERVQVGLLVGNLMESIEEKYLEDKKAIEAAGGTNGTPKKKLTQADLMSDKANFAGFM